MFSTRPSTGTCVFSNIRTPRRASASATSCGVDTITAPASFSFCAIVSCASPVPGGMSSTITSSSPQSTWPISCCSAPITIGPRHTMAVSGSTSRPIDMARIPHASTGSMRSPRIAGLPRTPSICGRLGP